MERVQVSLKLFSELQQSRAKHRLLEQRGAYQVMQYKNTRYLSSGGRAVQGAMDTSHPERVQSPVVAGMLQALLLIQQPTRALNLGVGSAAIERFLHASQCDAQLLSVDVSSEVIELATRYFFLPDDCKTECMAAEQFVETCSAQFDVIFCDLAMGNEPAACLAVEQFQQGCAALLPKSGVFAVNLLCNNNAELKEALLAWRRYFAWVALYAVPGFDNVVMYAAHQAPFSTLDAAWKKPSGAVSEALATAVILPP